jgi:hypothetical protein
MVALFRHLSHAKIRIKKAVTNGFARTSMEKRLNYPFLYISLEAKHYDEKHTRFDSTDVYG